HVVYLDLRHLGEKKINAKIPFVRELCTKYQNLDPVRDLIPVRPVIHYMMGGVHTDIDGATGLPGLFAAGEVACVSINGANRLGSNSLTELLVFGARAGRAAAAFSAESRDGSSAVATQTHDEEQRLEGQFRKGNRPGAGSAERIGTLRTEMQAVMEESAGIYRSGASLEQGAAKLQRLQERLTRVDVDDRSYTFNTEVPSALELSYMLDLAAAIVGSALARTESRGSHQRTDHPDRDDARFLAHSLVYRASSGDPQIEYAPVTITRWPPGKRVYGK
ncbi:MAG: FAD-binding protein, partial [Vicinamibacteraceae bacterium]